MEAKISPSSPNEPMLEYKEKGNYSKSISTLVESAKFFYSVEMEWIIISDASGPSLSPPEVVMKDAGFDLKQEIETSISYPEYGILCTHTLSYNITKSEIGDTLKKHFIVTDDNIKIHKWIKQKKTYRRATIKTTQENAKMIRDIGAIQIRHKQHKIYMQVKDNSAASYPTVKGQKSDKWKGHSTSSNKKIYTHKWQKNDSKSRSPPVNEPEHDDGQVDVKILTTIETTLIKLLKKLSDDGIITFHQWF